MNLVAKMETNSREGRVALEIISCRNGNQVYNAWDGVVGVVKILRFALIYRGKLVL